ncbi:MAG: methyltransferase, partial [bacterium]
HGTVQNYDFSQARHIVDIGGANGDLLLAILQANPQARGTVFDLPHVAESALGGSGISSFMIAQWSSVRFIVRLKLCD